MKKLLTLFVLLLISTVAHAQCDLNATTANFAAQLNAAQAGQSVCLASGNYGDWSGINKAITIRAASGATPKMRLAFVSNTANGGWTLDGVAIAGGDISGPAKNFTLKNGQVTKELSFFPSANNNRCSNCPAMNNNAIVMDNMDFNQADNSGQPVNYEGRLNFVDSGSTPAGITVKNSKFHEGCADGVQFSGGGRGVTIGPNNEFYNLRQSGCSAHVDSIQQVGGDSTGPVIDGNYFHDSTDGAVAYDGKPNGRFTNNVLVKLDGPYVNLAYGATGIIEHNTVGGPIVCNSTHDWNSSGQQCKAIVRNNIMTGVTITTSDQSGTNGAPQCSFNLQSGTTACTGTGSLKGSPTFVDGANPTTYAGFILAASSLGRGAASDGKDMGIASGAPPPGPLMITTANLPIGTVGTAYNTTLTASGGTMPYTWGSTGLPAGLSLGIATGAITGTPTAAANSNPTFTVVGGSTASKQLPLVVTATPPPAACDVGARCAVKDATGANIRSSAPNNDFGPKIGAAPQGSTFKVLTITNARIPQTPSGVVWKQVDFDDPSLPTGYMGSDNMVPSDAPPPPPTIIVNCAIAKAGFTVSNLPAGSMLTITGTIPGAAPVSCITLP